MIATHNTSQKMNDISANKILFGCSMFLSAGIWANNFHPALKIALAIVAGLTTIMAFFNQYKAFAKNYSGFWLVVRIKYVLGEAKKSRHRRGISIKKKS